MCACVRCKRVSPVIPVVDSNGKRIGWEYNGKVYYN